MASTKRHSDVLAKLIALAELDILFHKSEAFCVFNITIALQHQATAIQVSIPSVLFEKEEKRKSHLKI